MVGPDNLLITLDEQTKQRLHQAAEQQQRTADWLIKQAIVNYLHQSESGRIAPLADELTESITITAQPPAATSLPPFQNFAQTLLAQPPLRSAITQAYRQAETTLLPQLLAKAKLTEQQNQASQAMAEQLAKQLREEKQYTGKSALVQNLLQEFSLSSQEGIALMCLAEALLRIPDKATRDVLIRDKISQGNWQSHLGKSPSLFVNAATWGLVLTGKLVTTHSEASLNQALKRIVGRRGEPVIRKGVDMAMRLMGEQFVMGETIEQALENAKKREEKGFRYSYDMLGEAALTEQDAQRYFIAYQQAIHAIGKAAARRGIYEGPGISIKLSALHPRYCRAQYQRVIDELYPRLQELTCLARHYDIGINIDAEEADRLELSLDLLAKLCFEPALAGWNGIGFVIQAYQKRCPYVIDELIDLAQRSQHRLMIRLVKGAYWDSEIKRAQMDGLTDYPVYSRKVYTDVAYLACAKKLLAVPNWIYPQFATHNALTLASIYQIAGDNYYPGQYEFQCLHGMGEPLYDKVVGSLASGKFNRPCRIYAPVGTHETLLAYLVRRLLENGANSSFVNQLADKTLSLHDLLADPCAKVEQLASKEGKLGLPHPKIPLPAQLYLPQRENSQGLDLANEQQLASLANDVIHSAQQPWQAMPILADNSLALASAQPQPVYNPANQQDIVGYVQSSDDNTGALALTAASEHQQQWAQIPVQQRALLLKQAAQSMQQQMPTLIGIIIREAGKTFNNAIAEVREAIDFLFYYASQIEQMDNNTHQPLGVVVCISPWNFPLAIFTGQIAAALATGNCVIAKPAEQTPLIAAQAVNILHQAGIPRYALQLLPGQGETIGSALISDPRVNGVMFTGSTAVARLLQKTLATRLTDKGQPVVLIAETGGLNAMIVDSSALTEQVVNDVISSAFDSAGQRCSALRLLCVQEDVAEQTLNMLRGAMAEYRLANPDELATDIGPVIDQAAKTMIEQHIQQMLSQGCKIYQADLSVAHSANLQQGYFVPATLIELKQLNQLQQEIFGPVLHVVCYARNQLNELISQINATGYGLTFGIHTRIDETIGQLTQQIKAGNQYINRNIVGAVVGVQPFGGEGLSGTGPKAGGPLYLYRLLSKKPQQAIYQTLTDNPHYQLEKAADVSPRLASLLQWCKQQQLTELVAVCQEISQHPLASLTLALPTPTGEKNHYYLHARACLLSLADNQQNYLKQLAASLSLAAKTVWLTSPLTEQLYQQLPVDIQSSICLVDDQQLQDNQLNIEAVLLHGDEKTCQQWLQRLAGWSGAIVNLYHYQTDQPVAIEDCLLERSISINTAAAGGNASLMTIG